MNRENTLSDDVRQMQSQLNGMKTRQFIGNDSVTCYKTQTNNTWDYSWTPTFGGSQVIADLFMKFKSTRQIVPLTFIQIICLIDDTWYYTPVNFDTVGLFHGVNLNGTITGTYGNYSPDAPTPNTPQEISFYDAVTVTRSGANIKLKFVAYSTDTGKLKINFNSTTIVNM